MLKITWVFLENCVKRVLIRYFNIPLDISVQTVLRGSPILKVRQEVGHIHYFTKETAIATLIDTDYEIIDYFYTAASLDLPAKSIKSLLAKLPRKVMYKLNKNLTVRFLGGFSLMVLTK